MICVANGPREGGGFLVAPQAQPDDGLFDLCIAREVGRLAQLGLIPHFMKGTHVDQEPVTMARARRVTISSPDDLVAHVDGEVLCTDGHEIECEILPRRLRCPGLPSGSNTNGRADMPCSSSPRRTVEWQWAHRRIERFTLGRHLGRCAHWRGRRSPRIGRRSRRLSADR
jgi:hypothetical protein